MGENGTPARGIIVILRGVPSGEFPLPLLCDHIHFVPFSQPYLFSGDSSQNIIFYSHQKQYLGHQNQKKSVGYVLKYVSKGKNCLKFKAFPRIQSQSVSKASARPIFDFWAQMEARTENMSDINLIKHANPQLLSPNTGCLDKIQQF